MSGVNEKFKKCLVLALFLVLMLGLLEVSENRDFYELLWSSLRAVRCGLFLSDFSWLTGYLCSHMILLSYLSVSF